MTYLCAEDQAEVPVGGIGGMQSRQEMMQEPVEERAVVMCQDPGGGQKQ